VLVLMTRLSKVMNIALLKYPGAKYFDDRVSGNQEWSVNQSSSKLAFLGNFRLQDIYGPITISGRSIPRGIHGDSARRGNKCCIVRRALFAKV